MLNVSSTTIEAIGPTSILKEATLPRKTKTLCENENMVQSGLAQTQLPEFFKQLYIIHCLHFLLLTLIGRASRRSSKYIHCPSNFTVAVQ